MPRNLKSLIGKLDKTCRNALEAAAGLCLGRTHFEVDIEHVLDRLMEADNTDLHRIFRQFEIDPDRVQKDLTAALDRMKSGNTRTPVLSARLPQLFEHAWLLASVDLGGDQIRSGHLLLALREQPEFARLVEGSFRDFDRLSVETMRKNFDDLVAGSAEDAEMRARPAGAVPPSSVPAAGGARAGKTPGLDQYTVNLTERAAAGSIDPVLGRDNEVRQVIDILMRRRQNNPILTGEAGVGKTAVVEGLALRIATGDVPAVLRNVRIHALDLGLLQAGASVKGEFENRLRSVIDEVKASPVPIVMFIDEAHTMIGAGGQAGQNDAANLLKPALARGELRTVAATTWSEYKKYFEKDAALARRFQVVKVEEPSEDVATVMLRGVAAKMEQHHNVRVLDEAVVQAVELSHRYLTGRQLPDKAVSLLDTAAARVAMSQSAIPAPVEDRRRRIENIDTESRALAREEATGSDRAARLKELAAEREGVVAELAAFEERWEKEKALVEKIRELRARLEDERAETAAAKPPAKGTKAKAAPAGSEARAELQKANAELEKLQGEEPLVHVTVDGAAIAEVLSGWTGIPVGKMLKDEIATVLQLEKTLGARVVGQDHSLKMIAQRIRTSRASLEDPSRPIGVFLLVGPSGVGKTETALALADTLYGGERNLVTINMSEFQEAHTVSSLKGSPPGYVGYGEGGVLTEAVRRRPYCVVLLDEVEKAHPDVLELFFQVFDKGVLDDGEGREINFKNTVILLTSNVGSDSIIELCREEKLPPPDDIVREIWPQLTHAFKPAFLGRLVTIPYYPIGDGMLRQIIRLKTDRIGRRLMENHRASFVYGDDVVEEIAKRCKEVQTGARNIDHILTGTLLPEISETVLARLAAGRSVGSVKVAIRLEGGFAYDIA